MKQLYIHQPVGTWYWLDKKQLITYQEHPALWTRLYSILHSRRNRNPFCAEEVYFDPDRLEGGFFARIWKDIKAIRESTER